MAAETESSLVTRPSLLARLKDWNQQTAWREFDHDYAPLLRNVARKAGLSDVEADEVLQETLVAVAKKIGDFQHAGNRGSFRAWLYQQARWRIADQFRARKRVSGGANGGPYRAFFSHSENQGIGKNDAKVDGGAAELSDAERGDEGVPQVDPAFERLWDTEWQEHARLLAVERVKRLVSCRQFQLFDLHVLQGLPVRAAAEASGSTMAAVYMAKSRVSRILKREVKALKGQ